MLSLPLLLLLCATAAAQETISIVSSGPSPAGFTLELQVELDDSDDDANSNSDEPLTTATPFRVAWAAPAANRSAGDAVAILRVAGSTAEARGGAEVTAVDLGPRLAATGTFAAAGVAEFRALSEEGEYALSCRRGGASANEDEYECDPPVRFEVFAARRGLDSGVVVALVFGAGAALFCSALVLACLFLAGVRAAGIALLVRLGLRSPSSSSSSSSSSDDGGGGGGGRAAAARMDSNTASESSGVEDMNGGEGFGDDDVPSTECKVCMDHRINSVLVPCGHSAVCISCGKGLAKCPICRTRIDKVQRVFNA